jgi:outer membrane protein assembly factor BamA
MFGVFVQADWERDLQARYFGLGNNSSNKEDFTDSKNENFVDENFYLYNLKRPRLTIFGTRQIFPNVLFWFGFGLEKVEPQLKRGPDTSFLFKDRPFGFLGGSGRYLSFRLSWDTRSNEVFPTRGFLTELSVEPNFASVNQEVQGANGAEIRARKVTLYRYTFSDAHFIQLHSRRLIFANRMAFDVIAGDAPYYAYGDIAGMRRTRSLGGSQSLRGFQSRRFQDKIKFFTLTELRFNFKRLYLMEQTFDLIFMAFFDNGRVWSRWTELSLNNFHTTFGGGIWLNWNNRLIIRLDIGRSKEEIIPFFRLNSAF